MPMAMLPSSSLVIGNGCPVALAKQATAVSNARMAWVFFQASACSSAFPVDRTEKADVITFMGFMTLPVFSSCPGVTLSNFISTRER